MELSKSSAIIILVLTLLLLPASPNPSLVLASGALLASAILILWTSRDLPILLFPFGMQWLSVATKPMLTGIQGIEIQTLSERGAPLEQAAWFAIFGMTALLIGLRVGCRAQTKFNVNARLQAETRIYSPQYIVVFALALILVGHISLALAPSAGGLLQVALAVGDAKYAGIFLLVYSSIKLGNYRLLAIALCGVEIIIGMMGFFGEFRETLFMILLAVLLSQSRTSLANLLLGALAALMTLLVITFWSAVKSEYRAELNQGTQQQVVSISIEERLNFLSGAATNADVDVLNDGLERSLKRVSYIDFLGHTLTYVPEVVPHQEGGQTRHAITHVITPRVIFPSKPALPHDTYVTAAYTGLHFNQSQFASISIGYLGEFYVDYGYLGALLATLIMGFCFGKFYETILFFDKTPLFLNIAFAIVMVMPFIYFERALVKTMGGTLTYFFVIVLVQRFILPQIITLRTGQKRRRKAQPAAITRL